MTKKIRLDKVVSKIGDLPAIPGVVTEVMNLTSDPNASVSELSGLIERDPVLTTKLLKISNSAYYGMRQVVGTLKLALVILGAREVRSIVVGIAVLDTFRDEETEMLLGQHGLWQHSLLVAGIAKKLGTHLDLSLQGEGFIAGLIHDIGKLVLWKHLGAEYRELFERAQREAVPLHQLEQDVLGFNHADAAAALAEAWNLPETLSFAIGAHHTNNDRVQEEGPAPKLAALVRLANMAAHDDFENHEAIELPSCADDRAWKALTKVVEPVDIETRKEVLWGFQEEMNKTPPLKL